MKPTRVSAARIDDLREPLTQLLIEALGEDRLAELAFRSPRYILDKATDLLCQADVALAIDAAIDTKEIVTEARRVLRNQQNELKDRLETIQRLEAFNGK